jgi:hypothetical protein
MALGLMALVVLLVVSMGTLGRVETNRAHTLRQQAVARQHAFYALGLALGQLQDHAGPDRRATATAGILGEGVARQPHWTGVWDFTAGEPKVTWLVTTDPETGIPPDPRFAVAGAVRLVGAGAVPQEEPGEGEPAWVEVPALALFGIDAAGDAVVTGRIAWWTGDEGVKASIQAVDTLDALALDPRERQRRRQSAQQGVAWARWLEPDSELAALTPADWLEALDLGQVLAARGLDTAELRPFFHDLTLSAWGLLTNPLDGGLKLNLGSPATPVLSGRFNDPFGAGRVMRVWSEHPVADEAGVVEPRPISRADFEVLAAGEPYVHVGPVLSECAVYLSVFHYSFGGRIGPAVRYFIDAEFWNPYSFDLALVRGGDRRALTVEVRGLPELTVENLGTGAVAGPFPVDAMARAGGGAGVSSWMEFGEATGRGSGGQTVILRAGEVYQLQDPDPLVQARGLILYSDRVLPVEAGHRILLSGMPPVVTAGASGGWGGTDFRVTEGHDGAGRELFRLAGVPYEPFRYLFAPPLDGAFPPYLINSTAVEVADMYVLGFHYRLGASRDWQGPSEWLREFEFRRPVIAFEGGWTDTRGEGRRVREFVSLASRNPVETSGNLSDVFPGNEVLFDRVPRESGWGEYGDVRLYDLPAGDPVSLADFRILPYKDLPPLALGAAGRGAADLNRAFDRYFVAAVDPRGGLAGRRGLGGGRFLNPRLVPRPAEGARVEAVEPHDPHLARHLVVRGAFNWNSTRVRAWYAALVAGFGAEGRWDYTDGRGAGRTREVRAALFRHAQGGAHRQEPWSDAALAEFAGEGEDRRFVAFRQGGRFFEIASGGARPDGAIGDGDPLFRLARAIVAELRARGRPFPSLAAFLEDGLLQRAIDRSGINDGFPPRMNGHVVQSDLAALLGLAPAVRSDTFRIRALGEVLNPATGEVEGQARLEAVVRRTVEFVDPARPPAALPGAGDEGFREARRFQVVSFRWLHSSDDP